MWMGDYQLTRMADQQKRDNKDPAGEVSGLLGKLKETLYKDIGSWGKAARWVQIYIREK
jgi:hypothetical protein